MFGWLKRIFGGKQKISPAEAGATMGHLMFRDWPKEVSFFRQVIEPLAPAPKAHFEVEVATLRCFVFSYGVSRMAGFVRSAHQMDALKDAFHQSVAESLARQGWTRKNFESWNKIRESRYREYARLVEADESPASPKLGFSFINQLAPGTRKADLLEPGLKVGVWTGEFMLVVGKSLEGVELED